MAIKSAEGKGGDCEKQTQKTGEGRGGGECIIEEIYWEFRELNLRI